MPNTAARRLYDMLDSLVAVKLEFARGSEADEEFSSIGRAKIMEVHTVLDAAIYEVKRVIADIDRPRQRQNPAPDL